MVDFVFLGGKVGLCLLNGLFQRLLVLAQLGDVLILLGQLTVEGLDLVVLGLLLLLCLQSAAATTTPRYQRATALQSVVEKLALHRKCTHLQ